MPTMTDLLPTTKSNPHGAGIDWTPLSRPGTGTLTIKDRRAYTTYAVAEFPTQWDGRAFALAKHEPADDASGYEVFIGRNPSDRLCDCKGFQRWGGKCRHIAAMECLIGNGWLDSLPLVDPVPDSEPDFEAAFGVGPTDAVDAGVAFAPVG